MTQNNSDKGTKDETARTTANLLRRRKERSSNRGNKETADWESADPSKISALIGLVTFHKGTVTFGYTRDGSAYYLSYYVDSQSEKVYIRPTEDIDSRLDDEIADWTI